MENQRLAWFRTNELPADWAETYSFRTGLTIFQNRSGSWYR